MAANKEGTMRFSLMPKRSIFFTLFSQHAQNALEATQALEKLLTDFTEVDNKARDIHAIEHYGDKLTHQIMQELNGTFVAPLDREDIVGLASKLDDVTDVCHDVAEMVVLYKVRAIRPLAVQQAKVLVAAAEHLVTAIKDLDKLAGLEPHWIKIHTLENEGDQLFRTAVGNLFAETTDPVEIIKWKDLHALIEVAIDRCEDVANIVETIVVKHK
jgi:predicted phosphate transport protein (TIGR00153 family)